MPLNWGISKVANWEQVSMDSKNGKEAWITQALIWATMQIGMSSITEKNADEFYMRIALVQSEHPLIRDADGNPVLITLENIKRRIGFWTNASDIPRVRWDALRKKNAAMDAAYKARLEAKEKYKE